MASHAVRRYQDIGSLPKTWLTGNYKAIQDPAMPDRGPCWEVKESSLVHTNLRTLVIIYRYQSTEWKYTTTIGTFPFCVRVLAAFCSLSSPERIWSRAACPERSQSNPRVIQNHNLTFQARTTAPLRRGPDKTCKTNDI